MILPIDAISEGEHQSSRPRGLILDATYKEAEGTISAHDHRSGRNTASSNSVTLNELEGQICEISISHDGDFATAAALVPLMVNEEIDSQLQSHLSPRN